jgi:NDP-sugar pyrophosphorylase family protein
LIDHLARSGAAASATLAIGHLSEKIVEYFTSHPPSLPIRFVLETEALGTGGALLNALPSTTTDAILCLNGDSFFGANLSTLVAAHARQSADVTLALVQVDDRSRFGSVEIDDFGKVLSFSEKGAHAGSGPISAGVYVIQRSALANLAQGPSSLERDIFPRLAAQGKLSGVVLDGPFIDIGLPETYATAATFIEALEETHGMNNSYIRPR